MLADPKCIAEATVAVEGYLKKHSDSLEASLLLARLYGQSGKSEAAFSLIDGLKKDIAKNDATAIYNIATTELLLGRADQGLIKLLSRQSGGEAFTAALVKAYMESDLATAEAYADQLLEADMAIDTGMSIQEIESVELLKSKAAK